MPLHSVLHLIIIKFTYKNQKVKMQQSFKNVSVNRAKRNDSHQKKYFIFYLRIYIVTMFVFNLNYEH